LKNGKIIFPTILVSYIFFGLVINFQSVQLIGETSATLMIPEHAPIYPNNYFKKMIGTFTWNEFLSKSSWGLDFLSYRLFFWPIRLLFGINITQLLVIEKIVFSLLAFFGAFLLSKNYLSRFLKDKESKPILIASFIAGLVYGLNPSFMVGDSFWMGIQFSFITLPWIILSFNKVILDKNWKYTFLCAFLMATNIDEHFLWAGFPIILILYSVFIFIVSSFKEKRINFHPIISFLLVILIFVGLVSYRSINRLIIIPQYQLSLTKAGVDIPWMYASLPNMLRAMSHMELPVIYDTTYPIFSFLNSLMPLTLLIPIFAFISLLWYRKNWIVLFYGITIIISTLPFYVGSPLKQFHYWVFFNTPIGPAFRTWRVLDAYIALSLSMLIAFSLYHILQKLSNKRNYLKVLTITSIIFILLIYSWPILTGNINGKLTPVKVPNEYFKAHTFLSNQTEDCKVVYIPEFVYSYGKDSNLKPFWSPEWGAIQEFLTFSSPKPTFWPVGSWGHYYTFTLSPFYYSLLRTGNINTLAWFLNWANVKYIVVHDDLPQLRENMEKYINYLNESTAFKQVFSDGFIHIFENQFTTGKIAVMPETLIVDGGYRAVSELYNALNNSNVNYGMIFVDQNDLTELLTDTKIIVTDKMHNQLMADLIFNKVLHEKSNYILYPYSYVVEHDPRNKWSRASYLDPHQQVWHPYVNWQDYSWDFDYMKGVIFTDNSNDSIEIPVNLEKPGEYFLMLRLFANEKGGEITINIENTTFTIKTLNDYNGFLCYTVPINLNSSKNIVVVKNNKGFNAISVIFLIQKQEYNKLLENANDYISSRQLINPAMNLIENPSFEGALEHWKMDDNVAIDNKFKIFLDNSTTFSGNYSLKVITNYTKPWYGWSWIRSDWISVEADEEYRFITHIKTENVNASHIVLEAYDEINNRVFQLAQLPSATYGSFDWRIYKYKFTIPENITKIRVVLNAGWSNQNGSLAITWFDDIRLIPIKSKHLTLNL